MKFGDIFGGKLDNRPMFEMLEQENEIKRTMKLYEIINGLDNKQIKREKIVDEFINQNEIEIKNLEEAIKTLKKMKENPAGPAVNENLSVQACEHSRALKFRAFDKKNAKWSPCYGFHIIGETTIFDLLNQYSMKAHEDLEITQFTGLRDDFGVDIYEGDVIQQEDGVVGEVTWKVGSNRYDIAGWIIKFSPFYASFIGNADGTTIVGNRYNVDPPTI